MVKRLELSALVGAVLKAAGYRVGAFTSPHLSSVLRKRLTY